MSKKRRHGKTPAQRNRPKKSAASLDNDPNEGYPSFSFRHVDQNGSWAWNLITDKEKSDVLDFMVAIGQMTWKEIDQQHQNKHHYHKGNNIDSEAQERLRDLNLDDQVDNLYRFRLGGKKRLWGFRTNGIFYVLWWDPKHKVYSV